MKKTKIHFNTDVYIHLFNQEGRLMLNSPKDRSCTLEIDQDKLFEFLKTFEKKEKP